MSSAVEIEILIRYYEEIVQRCERLAYGSEKHPHKYVRSNLGALWARGIPYELEEALEYAKEYERMTVG